MILRYLYTFFIIFFTIIPFSFWTENEEIQWIIEDYGINYPKNSYIENPVSIDLSPLNTLLRENYPNVQLEYEWIIPWASTQNSDVFERKFDSYGNKDITLEIYSVTNDFLGEWDDEALPTKQTRELISTINIPLFIYNSSTPLLVEENVSSRALEEFTSRWKDFWVLIQTLGIHSEENLIWSEIIRKMKEYRVSFPNHSDYLMIWWGKEFLFSAVSQIHAGNNLAQIENINIALVSSFNNKILKSYIGNNIAGKEHIGLAFIIDEALRNKILTHPSKIYDLQKEVENNNFEYAMLSEWVQISPYLFMSQFVNKLSNMGINTSDIYIILLLPLFLSLVSFAKHMIGLSTLGNIIPVFIALLFIKLSIVFTLWILWLLLICNIILWRILNKYTLLYSPKVSLITIVNLIFFMGIYHIITYFWLIDIPINDVLYIAIFFIIAEKLITIITSKEFREYKKSINGTIVVSLISYMLFHFDGLRVFLMAYPEVLLIFIPINFFIGRFTWLRVTEYFRFKEIINNIEE